MKAFTKLLLIGAAAGAGYMVYRQRMASRAEDDLWSEATNAPDLTSAYQPVFDSAAPETESPVAKAADTAADTVAGAADAAADKVSQAADKAADVADTVSDKADKAADSTADVAGKAADAAKDASGS